MDVVNRLEKRPDNTFSAEITGRRARLQRPAFTTVVHLRKRGSDTWHVSLEEMSISGGIMLPIR